MRPPMSPRAMLRQIASFRTGAWLVGCTVVLACFVAVVTLTLLADRLDADRQAEAVASSAAALAVHEIARTVERFDEALQSTISRLQSPAFMTLDEPMRSVVLFDRASGLQPLGFINVLDESGTVTQSPQPSERQSRWGSRPYFAVQRANPSLGLYISRSFGQDDYASIALSRRVSHEDGAFGGVVVASLRLSHVRDLFRQLTLGPNGSIALLHNDGSVLIRWPLDSNNLGRAVASGTPADEGRRRLAVRQIGELPLSVHVSAARDDFVGLSRSWAMATLVAGTLLTAFSGALMLALQRETWRREAAERDNRQKSDYLAMASHELRTPLHSILGNADRLRADAHLAPDNARRVTAIISAGNHLRGVVDRVLNHLQIEARLPTPHVRQVDLAELLDQCCIIVESDATARRLGLRYEVMAGTPEQFGTDPDLLRQVFVNLLSNAIKFTARGEIAIEIGGTAERITIEVKDTGRGIAEDQRHKLFKYGERLGAEATEIPGHGIGLAMSKRIVQSMGGAIGYRENAGGGSVFWVSLPAGQLPKQSASESTATSGPVRHQLHVLLVDDVTANREIARCLLTDHGHVVTEATNGVEAVRLATEDDFDVVLMDVRMPGMDGFEATRRIRLIDGKRGRVPIIAVTANALDQQIIEGRLVGMVEHLVKPFAADQLLAAVERIGACRPADEPAAFNPDALAQLSPCVSSGDIERHLLDLAGKLETLLQGLQNAEAAEDNGTLADLAHAGSPECSGSMRCPPLPSVSIQRMQRARNQRPVCGMH